IVGTAVVVAAVAGATAVTTPVATAIVAVIAALAAGGLGIGGAEGGVEDFALVDPHLHTDAAIGSGSLGEAVVDVGAEGLQGDGALVVGLAPGDFSAAQTAAAGDL